MKRKKVFRVTLSGQFFMKPLPYETRKAEYIMMAFSANEDIDVIERLVQGGVENYTSTICFMRNKL